MSENYWDTKLSYTSEDGIQIRGYDLVNLIGNVPFPSVLYLLYTGELPSSPIAKLIDALMVASIDHGAGTPSVLAARTTISGGAPLAAAGATGLLTLGKYHGAAVEDSMEAIQQVATLVRDGVSLNIAAEQVVTEWRKSKGRISGFGHRQHKEKDPRLTRLFILARDAGVQGQFLEASLAIESALKTVIGKDLPINIDGAMAAILLEIGFPPGLANALFMVSRITGIFAHAHEEQTLMPPMRRIHPTEHGYSGPPKRKFKPEL